MRERGFYDVRRKYERTDWTIAEWDGQFWSTAGDLPALSDDAFAEIGDRVPLKHERPK